MMGLQSGKGSTATPNIAVPFLDDGFNTKIQMKNLKDSGDNEYLLENFKMEHKESFGFSFNARPDIVSYLSAFMLGDSAIAGDGDPYTHTITRDERSWLTMERKLNTTIIQRLIDCKFENMTIAGETGKVIKITIDGNALDSLIKTTALSPSYDIEKPFMFYHGKSRFKIDTTNSSYIKGFEIKVNVNSGSGLKDDQFEIIDLPDFNYSVNCTLDLYTSDFTRFKKINYNASTTPQETLSTGSFEIDCQYVSTTTRQFKMIIPLMTYKSINGITLDPSGKTMSENIAGIAVKQNTTDLMTITCKNSISTTII